MCQNTTARLILHLRTMYVGFVLKIASGLLLDAIQNTSYHTENPTFLGPERPYSLCTLETFVN